MIPELVKRWDKKKEELRAQYTQVPPGGYDSIVKDVVKFVTSEDDYDDCNLDPERITVIDHGHYQGDRLYVIAAKGYQPSEYWFCNVSYGSCSGCDSFEAIRDYDGYNEDGTLKPNIVEQYMTLALHILQGIKLLGGE